jgi:hypothetical protein
VDPAGRPRSCRWVKHTDLETVINDLLAAQYGNPLCVDWIKMKNPNHPAMTRVKESFA